MKIRDIYNLIDKWAPFDTAEKWDNVGLMVGDTQSDVSGILIALDITREVIAEASEIGANLIITHHPVIFDEMLNVTQETVQGIHIAALVKEGISVISAHTNLDIADGGVSCAMAEKLGLSDVRPADSTGLLRVGSLPYALDTMAFGEYCKKVFSSKCVTSAGNMPKHVKKVCVSGGAAGDYIAQAKDTKADVFLLGSLKHEQAIEAQSLGVFCVAVGHYESEIPVLSKISAYLQKSADVVQSIGTINISKSGRNPFSIMV